MQQKLNTVAAESYESSTCLRSSILLELNYLYFACRSVVCVAWSQSEPCDLLTTRPSGGQHWSLGGCLARKSALLRSRVTQGFYSNWASAYEHSDEETSPNVGECCVTSLKASRLHIGSVNKSMTSHTWKTGYAVSSQKARERFYHAPNSPLSIFIRIQLSPKSCKSIDISI